MQRPRMVWFSLVISDYYRRYHAIQLEYGIGCCMPQYPVIFIPQAQMTCWDSGITRTQFRAQIISEFKTCPIINS